MTVYLDDILIFTQILEDHRAVHSVIEVLAEYNLFLHSEKYKFTNSRLST